MPVRRSLSEEQVRELKAAIQAARTADELRRGLCVWLPEFLGLTSRQLSAALLCSPGTVRLARSCYWREGAQRPRDRRRQPFPPDAGEALAAGLKRARNVEEFRRIQSVLLTVLFGLPAKQVAAAIGWRRSTVSWAQSVYRRRGLEGLISKGGARPAPAEAAAGTLRAAMKRARTVPEFRRAQCLYLREVLGLSSAATARILGWRQDAVARWHSCYRREGDRVLRTLGRGGRRWRLLSRRKEDEVLRTLARQYVDVELLMFPEIHRAFDEAAGCPLKAAVVLEILIRHGWTFVGVVATPR